MNRTTGHPQILITGVENRPDIEADLLEYVSRKVGEVKCHKLIQPVSKERDCHIYIRFWQNQAVERVLEYLESAGILSQCEPRQEMESGTKPSNKWQFVCRLAVSTCD